jgi:hypothetical protein
VLGDGEIAKCSDTKHLNDEKINFYFLSFLILPNSDMNRACPDRIATSEGLTGTSRYSYEVMLKIALLKRKLK